MVGEKSVGVFLVVFVTVVTHEFQEDGGEQHEHQGLDKSDEHLQEVEGHGWQPGEVGGHSVHHRLEDILTGKDISIETEAQGDGAHGDGYDFE